MTARNLSLRQVHPCLSSSHVTSHLRQTYLSSLIVRFHEVSDSFVNPCSNTSTKAWPLPGEQIQQTTGPAWFLPPSPMALPHFCLVQPEQVEMASSTKLLHLGKERREGAWISVSATSSAVRPGHGWGLEPTQAAQTKKLRDGLTVTLDMTARPHHRKWREQCHWL